MDQDLPIAGSGQSGDLSALQDIATNGKLLSEAISQVIQKLQAWQELVLKAAHGGTGLDTYVIGDLLYADSATTLARLADVAVGKVLLSGGVGAPPAWGDVSTGIITGVLPVANGGTGRSTLTVNSLLVGDGSGDIDFLVPATSGHFLLSNGTAWAGAAPATVAQYRSNASGSLALTPNSVWNAAQVVALSDAATIALDLSTGFNFSVSISDNRTLGNPTNVKVGQAGCIAVTASGATRTLNFGSNWYATSAISLPISITSATTCYVLYFAFSSSIILLTGVLNNPT